MGDVYWYHYMKKGKLFWVVIVAKRGRLSHTSKLKPKKYLIRVKCLGVHYVFTNVSFAYTILYIYFLAYTAMFIGTTVIQIHGDACIGCTIRLLSVRIQNAHEYKK